MRKILIVLILFAATVACLHSQSQDSIIVVENGRSYKIYDNSKEKVKGEFGAVIGTPGVVNVVMAAHTGGFLFKFSGGFLGSGTYGAQFEVGYKFYEEDETYHGFGLGIGHSVLTTNDDDGYYRYPNSKRHVWDYAAISYLLNTRGLYINLGLSHGQGSYPSPQLLFQIGYVFQIR